MAYHEPKETGNPYRKDYLDSITNLITRRQSDAEKKRNLLCEDIIKNAEFYRDELKKMLGWPLYEYNRNKTCEARINQISKDSIKTTYRVQIEVFKNFWFYGILFVHNEKKNRAFVICQHGGDGSPELCSSLFEAGTSNYNDMTMRVFEEGADVFAPQLLLWNKEAYKLPYDRVEIDAALKQTGSSIAALEIYSIQKSIDWLCDNNYADENRMGFCGLSYGGFYALYTSAIDTRIKACLSSCFYGKRDKYPWSDLTWENIGEKFYDSEISMLIYPRKLKIQIGENDGCFNSKYSKAEYSRLLTLCNIIDSDWIDFKVFDGTHEFWKDNQQINSLINDLK